MADGVAITAGSGTTILTDDTGAGGHAQIVKLAISTDSSATLIPADATNGIDVDVTRNAPPVTGSGSLTALNNAVTLTLNGEANTAFQLTGTWTATVTFEASNDNTNWTSIYSYRAGDNSISQTVVNSTNNDIYRCTTAGFGYVRCRCSDYTSGTIVVTAIASPRTSGVFINFPLPPGTSTIGAVTGTGTFAVQVDGSALTSLQLIDDPVIADDSAFTPATSKVMMAGFEADETSTDSVDEGDAGAARMTLDRKQIVTPQPHSIGGLSTMNASSSDGGTALTSTAQAIKASAGQLYGYFIYNPNATAIFVQFYNVAQASVTVGTTNPLFMLTIPPASAANLMGTMGISFSTAMSWSATSTAGGNGSPATALDAVCWYS